jgi:hypothetical protein
VPDIYSVDLTVAPTGRWLAIKGGYQPVQIWDLHAPDVHPELVTFPDGEPSDGIARTFTPDGRILIDTERGIIRFWLIDHEDLCVAARAFAGRDSATEVMKFLGVPETPTTLLPKAPPRPLPAFMTELPKVTLEHPTSGN